VSTRVPHSSNRPLQDVILSRRLLVSGRPKRHLTVRFERPRRWRRNWACRFEFRGLGKRELHQAYGVDSVQALTLAIEMARILIDTSRVRVAGTFADEPGGLPRILLTPFGRAETEEIHKAIDRASSRVARRLGRAGKARSHGAAALPANAADRPGWPELRVGAGFPEAKQRKR
jgi:hypothetical protein